MPEGLALAYAAIFGLIFGSFATAVAHRVPREESLGGRSRCPSCGATITAAENVPVLSYLFLRGKCRHCGARISPRYPLIEAASAVLFVLAIWKFGATGKGALYAAFFWVLLVLTVIDLEHKLLPNVIVFPSLAAGFAGLVLVSTPEQRSLPLDGAVITAALVIAEVFVVMLWPEPGEEPVTDEPPAQASFLLELVVGVVALVLWLATMVLGFLDGPYGGLAGALVGAGVFSGMLLAVAGIGTAVARRAAMGGGDIKLALVLGAFLGFIEAPAVVLAGIFLAVFSGGLRGIFALVLGGERRAEIPFGPFLALGSIVAVLAGRPLIDWYEGLLL